MKRAVLLALALLAITAVPAAAQPPALGLIEPLLGALVNPAELNSVSSTSLPVRSSGEIVVSFDADPRTGCAVHGACAYHGTMIIDLAGSGLVHVVSYRVAGRRVATATLDLASSLLGSARYTWTRVQRDLPGGQAATCVDAQPGGAAVGRRAAHAYRFALADLLSSTRCAAPLPADLVEALPHMVLSDAQLARGGGRLDLGGVRSFASEGFAGTVTSTLVIEMGHPHSFRSSPITGGPRTRVVSELLRITHASGAFRLDVHGASATSGCAFLDSCGVAGTLTMAPRPSDSAGMVTAAGPARRPLRDFLAALGQRTFGARARGITVVGIITWNDGGTVREQVRQAAPCTDSARLDGGLIVLATTRSRLVAGYLGLGGQTRCPGPLSPSGNPVAFGTVPLSRLGGRTFTLALRPDPQALDDDGYKVAVRGELRLTFRRSTPVQQITDFWLL